jgi:hypothetical protein
MRPPPWYSIPEGMVCHLRCSLYSVKQAHQAWFQHFASVVTTTGFFASAHDPALLVYVSPRGRTLLILYVNDMTITDDDPEYIAFVKARLSDQFLMSNLGPLRYFLEIEISSMPEVFCCLKRSIFKIFSIVLLLQIIGLLRLPWSSMFTIHPLMVSLLRILLIIITL